MPDPTVRRFTAWRQRRQARRLERAEMALADAEHHFDTWVEPFHRGLGSYSPSQMKRERAKVERARRRVVKRGGGR